jgi:nucleotidyltransferase substrate binding protein (TIGR01987 family)
MNNKTIRWKQRFQNLKRAYLFLSRDVNRENLSELEMAGIISAFQFTFELSWKTLKDYLESKGLDAKTPRDVIKESFSIEILADGKIWLKMLDARNLFAHVYDEGQAKSHLEAIRKNYLSALKQVFDKLSELEKEK